MYKKQLHTYLNLYKFQSDISITSIGSDLISNGDSNLVDDCRFCLIFLFTAIIPIAI